MMGKSSLVTLPLTLLLVSSILALSSISAAGVLQGDALGRKVGGREKVHHVKKNKEIQDLGSYAVAEYNRNIKKYTEGNHTDGRLTFSGVVEAEQQVVAGRKYYLKISATSASGVPKIFDAVVVERAWEKEQPRQLLTFSPSPPTE